MATHLFQASDGERVSATDTQVCAIGDAGKVGRIVAEGESNFADVFGVC